MKKNSLLALATIFTLSGAVLAADCGEPPLITPSIPEGTTADANDIRTTRDAVVSYSEKVDAYLTCMDEKAQIVFPYMTKEQKFRWDEDLAAVHNARRDAQTAMNEAIRAYRRASQ